MSKTFQNPQTCRLGDCPIDLQIQFIFGLVSVWQAGAASVTGVYADEWVLR